MDDVAADGADVELAPHHIGGDVPVDNVLTVHQFNNRDPQSLSQRLQQGDVGQALGGLPLGYGFAADTNFLR